MEPNSPKKIQFAMPLFQSQLDPEAAEQIRRRRPTPASLVILNESSPEVDEKRENNPQGKNAEMSPQQRKKSVYTPPTMKELQLLVEQHLQKQDEPDQDYSESDPSCLDELSPMMTECCHSNGDPAFLADTDWGTLNCCEHISSQTGIKLLLSAEDHPDTSSIGVAGTEQAVPLKCNDDGPHQSSRGSQQQQTETDDQCMKPRRKDTPFQHQPPLVPGVKLLRSQNETSFPEEEEGANEREDWSP
ncbi:protein phosphatase 1 regulatory subunit 1C isoform X1 [Callorhinchus milii]|uniref:protein phosphatase 1 regulatory subunit 1C isoform X1 n=1 Tax=Callorhinchus milii TaxID=7868 RepID=UPI00045717BE|nr:protein phosphatase 1 regulatory subunit 1C isoform X1 [Callorhinchus milii]|eukprot:gi/632945908/ref/XP_007888295.1/ PREDICTED: protein phosphatase 1 regulatory subunit 1C isoform X1 [Callorhinchus milii]